MGLTVCVAEGGNLGCGFTSLGGHGRSCFGCHLGGSCLVYLSVAR